MDNLAHSEIFALTLVIGTYLTSLALYKKVHISLLHPLLTTIFVIIVVLEVLGIQYESFQQSSHLIHFMLGPSVVARLSSVAGGSLPNAIPRERVR